MDTIEVNGIKYVEKEKEKVQSKGSSVLKAFPLFTMGHLLVDYKLPTMYYNPYMPKVKKEPQRPDINIIKEYGLIQLKKSALSRSQRDMIVWKFERLYQRID